MQAIFSRAEALRGAYVLAILLLSAWAVGFYISQKSHLLTNDAIYYISLAESFEQTGRLHDLTRVPQRAAISPQNGIVLIYVLFFKLGLGYEGAIVALVLLNYLLHLTTVYPLVRIARRLGLEDRWALLLLVGVHLGSWQVYESQLPPINDGIFNTVAIWLSWIYLNGLTGQRESEGGRRYLLWAGLLTALAVHFRLQILLVSGSALVTALLIRKFRTAAWISGILAAGALSLALQLPFLDLDGIQGNADRYMARVEVSDEKPLYEMIRHLYVWFSRTLPDLFFADAGLPANLLYLAFYAALGLAVLRGVRGLGGDWLGWPDARRGLSATGGDRLEARRVGLMFITLVCCTGLLFTTVMLAHKERYAISLFPLFYLFLFLSPRLRSIGHLFAVAVLISTVGRYIVPIERTPRTKFWLDAYEEQVRIPPDALLISQQARYPYFFLRGARTFAGRLTRPDVEGREAVYLLGFRYYVRQKKQEILELLGPEDVQYSESTVYSNKELVLVELELLENRRGEPRRVPIGGRGDSLSFGGNPHQ